MTGARIDVVAAVIVDDLAAPTRLLTAQRTEPPLLAGGWEIPGGKVDPGESLDQALHREIREELGVGISLGEVVPGPLDGWWPLGERARLRVRFAVVTDGEPAALEAHSEVRWVSRTSIWSVDWLPGNRPIIEAVLAELWPDRTSGS